MFKTNQPIKVIHLQKLTNQSTLNGALVIEILSNSLSENKRNFEKQIRHGMKNIFPLHFIKYLSYLKVQKKSKVVNV